MRARAAKDGLTLRVIAGTNNVLLAMDLQEAKRKGCLGFTIERSDVETGELRWLPNLLRFETDAIKQEHKKPAKPEPEPSVSSARAPLQTFRWGDYTVEPGKRYRYRVVARYEAAADIIKLGKDAEHRHTFDCVPGGVSVEIKSEDNRSADAAVFFNRGAAASKAYNDRFGDNDPRKIPEAMRWLSRGLEEAVTTFIGHAADSSFALHAAIYEFQKPELLRALKQAKAREAEVQVVYHGRVKTADANDKTARKNAAAAKQAGIDFAKPRSADPQGAIMHNKFMVLLKKSAAGSFQPIAVWTGSTNWTDGGIFGQLNVGHAIYDTAVAAKYEDYFKLLYNDESAETMKEQTAVLTPVPKNRDVIRQGITPVFSPQQTLAMIDLYADICKKAKVLMVCAPFELHETIRDVFKKAPPNVVRFLMADKEGSFGKQGEIELLEHEPGNEVTVATILKTALHDFQGGLLEGKESFHHAGVHVHSKIIAADPFGADPILVTGSANFSNNSTRVNDSNSVIIRGDTATMDVYVTEFMRMFEHYWFRAHMQGKTKGGAKKKTERERRMGLVGDSSWTDRFYRPGSREMLERLAFAGLGI